MWPLVLLSLALFGIHQLTVKRDLPAPVVPDKPMISSTTLPPLPPELHRIPNVESIVTVKPDPNAQATKKPTTTTETTNSISEDDPNYTYVDPPTKKVYKFPKLGSCKPFDGYKRLPSTEDNLWFENNGPEDQLLFSDLKIKYGFIWKNSPSIEVLHRINISDIAGLIRKEIDQKIDEISESRLLTAGLPGTVYDWGVMKNNNWPIESIAVSRNVSFIVPIDKKSLLFQLLMKCGDYTIYTDEIHYLELDSETGECDEGSFAFRQCQCSEPEKACPELIE